MDITTITDAARTLHLIGLAGGFGLAIFADTVAARALFSPIKQEDIDLMHRLHTAIWTGLGLLWISGLSILYIRTGFDVAAFSPKLIAKLFIVTLLTVNAVLLGKIAMPLYEQNCGRHFHEFGVLARVQMGALAGISLSCWFSGLFLGAFTQLKPMGAEPLIMIFGGILTLGIGGAVTMSVVFPKLAVLKGNFVTPEFAEKPA